MVTLVQENLFSKIFRPRNFGPMCVLTGIGEEPVHGQLVHNFPINIGTQTFLHTVCVAPIKDTCLLGLDSLIILYVFLRTFSGVDNSNTRYVKNNH